MSHLLSRYKALFWAERNKSHDTDTALAAAVGRAYRDGYARGLTTARTTSTRKASPYLPETVRIVKLAGPYRKAVARHFGMQVSDLWMVRRSRTGANPLQVLAWLLREVERFSFPQIAIAMERGDHTTAMAAVRKVERLIAERPELRDELLAVMGGAAEARGAA